LFSDVVLIKPSRLFEITCIEKYFDFFEKKKKWVHVTLRNRFHVVTCDCPVIDHKICQNAVRAELEIKTINEAPFGD